jgi:hypothetical protein
MRLLTRGLAALFLCWLVNAPPVAAQRAATKWQGFWFGAGFGYGTAHLDCAGCTADDRSGVTAFIKIGGTPNPRLRLGFELNVWTQHEPTLTQRIGNLSGTLSYHPKPPVPFFFKVGAGVGFSRFKSETGGPSRALGLGGTLGIGADARIGRHVSLTPVANLYMGMDGDQTSSGVILGESVTHRIVELGLGVTLH